MSVQEERFLMSQGRAVLILNGQKGPSKMSQLWHSLQRRYLFLVTALGPLISDQCTSL